ncbi:unnamed protein product [Linum tenue]|uniref:Uncharacterized protein n=1 Tax=Linum tenue TaxID=586396 RepID=A0AAV0MX30_9ROSI|nr:unnamed protein product [Linum tenue]
MGLPAPSAALIFVLVALFTHPIHAAADSRKLDETADGTPGSEKCTPCNPSPPPPSPSPPPPACPPPPALPPPSPPPPKNPPSTYCPPPPPPSPPSSSIIYITGPPGNLYPVDNDFSGSGRPTASAMIGCGLVAAAVGVLFGI